MTAAWGCCPAPRHPGELLNPQRRVPGACRPRRGRTTWRATRRRARAALARRGPARGLPRGLVPVVERREPPPTSPPRGLGNHAGDVPWRAPEGTGTGRTHRPPPSPAQLCVRLDAGCRVPAGSRLTGRGESPAPADRVVSLSPSCRAAAGTVSRATVSDSTPTAGGEDGGQVRRPEKSPPGLDRRAARATRPRRLRRPPCCDGRRAVRPREPPRPARARRVPDSAGVLAAASARRVACHPRPGLARPASPDGGFAPPTQESSALSIDCGRALVSRRGGRSRRIGRWCVVTIRTGNRPHHAVPLQRVQVPPR